MNVGQTGSTVNRNPAREAIAIFESCGRLGKKSFSTEAQPLYSALTYKRKWSKTASFIKTTCSFSIFGIVSKRIDVDL